jgi:SAM-dependent methyltransferase
MKSRRPRTPPIRPAHDGYGQEIWHCHQGKTTHEIIERDDGYIDLNTALAYFREEPDWPSCEREAIRRVRGPALDIGCGAGRVALHLQQKRIQVTAIDNSPQAIKVARLRGVSDTRVLDIRDVGTLPGPFAAFVLFGNNFGLFGGLTRARRLLAAMHRISTPDAQIIAAVTNPHQTSDPVHLSYLRRNRKRGRLPGQIRLRIRFDQFVGPWFDYLFVSPSELRSLLDGTGWRVAEMLPGGGPQYCVILAKR